MQLDALDAAILRALLIDGRASMRAVARSVGSTPTTVGERLRRLEEAGLVRGAALHLDPALLPGRARLARGRVRAEARDAVLRAGAATPGVSELLIAPSGRLVAVMLVRDLADEERVLAALVEVGAMDLTVEAVERTTGPPPSHLFAAPTAVAERCAQCGRETRDPLTEQVDGRRVPFCCASCRALFLERHAQVKSRALR